jgi:hypothetical protein
MNAVYRTLFIITLLYRRKTVVVVAVARSFFSSYIISFLFYNDVEYMKEESNSMYIVIISE